MGMFLGKIYVETPKHEVKEKGTDYEIREYPPAVVAEVSYDASSIRGGRDGGFMMLATYIGAFGKAANVKAGSPENESEQIAMTAPVITKESSEPIPMTAPVITKESATSETDNVKLTTMQFILPSTYTIDTVPKPTDERVKVTEIPTICMGAIAFSGVANERLTQKKLGVLRSALHGAGYRITGEHVLARYNDPFTPWFLRTNEVLVPVEKES